MLSFWEFSVALDPSVRRRMAPSLFPSVFASATLEILFVRIAVASAARAAVTGSRMMASSPPISSRGSGSAAHAQDRPGSPPPARRRRFREPPRARRRRSSPRAHQEKSQEIIVAEFFDHRREDPGLHVQNSSLGMPSCSASRGKCPASFLRSERVVHFSPIRTIWWPPLPREDPRQVSRCEPSPTSRRAG